MKKKLTVIVGTRPNFIKVTRFKDLADRYPKLDVNIVHTGQHFDEKMAGVFFSQLGLKPDHFISLESQSALSQIGEMIVKLEQLFVKTQPDLVMVVGDVNSTLAGAIVANKMNITLLHLESGLRSFDEAMPEEWNRVVTDRLSSGMFVTEHSGVENLLREGRPAEKIYFVGNTMIDSLVKYQKQINSSAILDALKLEAGQFILMTVHRPATVDSKDGLLMLLEVLRALPSKYPVVFPIHPRTRKHLESFGFANDFFALGNVKWIDPLDYFSFQKLISNCLVILTDSGGIQEEATFCGVPCLTLRENTERPSTIDLGTNVLIPFRADVILDHLESVINGTYKKGAIPPLWDGHATERILTIISENY